MLLSTHSRIRLASLLAIVVAAFLLAPSAFARGHHNSWGISLGFAGPGYSIGYNDCRHCGGSYVIGNFYGGYSSPGYYGGSYYGSSYSPGYYGGYSSYSPGYSSYGYPSYGYPSYGASYNYYPSRRSNRHHRRTVTRRVVQYDTYYTNDRRDHRSSRSSRSHRNSRRSNSYGYGYGDRDRGYSQRAAYYDRRN